MKKKLLIILLGLLLIAGCKKERIKEAETKTVENPVLVDRASKIVTEEIDMSGEDSPVASYYLEYIFKDNFCYEAIYHTKFKVKSNTEYNLNYINGDEEYENAYIDDDGYLVYSYKGDGLLGKSVRNVLIYLQYDKTMNVEVFDE